MCQERLQINFNSDIFLCFQLYALFLTSQSDAVQGAYKTETLN